MATTTQQQARRAPACKGISRSWSFYFFFSKKVFDLLKNKGRGGLARDIQGEQTQQRRQSQGLTKNNIQPIELETPQSEKLLDHQIIGETIQAMSEREEKLDRLKKIEKHLGAESDSSDEESTDEMPHASIEAKEFQTKIFALETKVPNRTLNPSSIKVYFKLDHIKYQIASPNISADHIESLINQEKLYSKKTIQPFFQSLNTKKKQKWA